VQPENVNRRGVWQRCQILWQKYGWILLIFAASRLTILAVILFSRQVIYRGPMGAISEINRHGGTLLDILTQWDGVWYRTIARFGYLPPTSELAAAFFPVYPIVIRAFEFLVRDYQLASVLAANSCLLAAAFLLHRLLRLDYDELICRRVILFLLFNPVSFFLSCAYSESTFLLLSIGALLAARQGKWLIAGLCGLVLSATRAPGLLIAIPLLTEYLVQQRAQPPAQRRLFSRELLFVGLVPIGLFLYLSFWYLHRGDFFVPMQAQVTGWNKTVAWPWQSFLWPNPFPVTHIPLYRTIVAGAAVLVMAGFYFRLRATYVVYAILSLLFYLSWGTLDALPRFISVIFPVHIALALVSERWKWLYEPLLAFSVALLVLCTVLFANAYHMT
jgi:hypothetical protein